MIQIGTTTCGKPYGFFGVENCGTTYFSVNFRASNHQGYGDYAEGFSPSSIDDGESNVRGCQVFDDINHPLGDINEARLATALYYRNNGSCPAAPADLLRARVSANTPLEDGELLVKSEWDMNMYIEER